MDSEGQDTRAIVEVYREQFGRVHHLDRMVLATFALLVSLLVALFVVIGLGVFGDSWSQLSIMLLAMALAAGGAHMVVANASDYWVTWVVITQMTKGLGLVQRGLFPASLLAHAPARGFWSFVRRLLAGFRGPLLLIYLSLGWYGAFRAYNLWLPAPLSFGLAVLPPFLLAMGSAVYYYNRMRQQMATLRRHEELEVASRDEIVDRHCDFAEALLRLDPPRVFHAQKQYELALEIEPDNPRAKESLQRLLAWKTGAPRPES